jgi:hypothetical protein
MKISFKTRALAFVCRICPFCVAARIWRDSKFATKLREMEKDCPACRAYNQLRSLRKQGEWDMGTAFLVLSYACLAFASAVAFFSIQVDRGIYWSAVTVVPWFLAFWLLLLMISARARISHKALAYNLLVASGLASLLLLVTMAEYRERGALETWRGILPLLAFLVASAVAGVTILRKVEPADEWRWWLTNYLPAIGLTALVFPYSFSRPDPTAGLVLLGWLWYVPMVNAIRTQSWSEKRKRIGLALLSIALAFVFLWEFSMAFPFWRFASGIVPLLSEALQRLEGTEKYANAAKGFAELQSLYRWNALAVALSLLSCLAMAGLSARHAWGIRKAGRTPLISSPPGSRMPS